MDIKKPMLVTFMILLLAPIAMPSHAQDEADKLISAVFAAMAVVVLDFTKQVLEAPKSDQGAAVQQYISPIEPIAIIHNSLAKVIGNAEKNPDSWHGLTEFQWGYVQGHLQESLIHAIEKQTMHWYDPDSDKGTFKNRVREYVKMLIERLRKVIDTLEEPYKPIWPENS